MIIGPPGPTGLIDTVCVLPGCTTGDGSGVRRIAPPIPAGRRCTVIRGGWSPGSETKDCSFPGWVAGRRRIAGAGAGCATVNEKRRTGTPRTRTTARTRSPAVNGAAGTKLAPRAPA